MRSYARRKSWEAKLLAGEIGQVMAKAMSASMGGGGSQSGDGRISPDVMLGKMGVRL